jgi:hypothetical protein
MDCLKSKNEGTNGEKKISGKLRGIMQGTGKFSKQIATCTASATGVRDYYYLRDQPKDLNKMISLLCG